MRSYAYALNTHPGAVDTCRPRVKVLRDGGVLPPASGRDLQYLLPLTTNQRLFFDPTEGSVTDDSDSKKVPGAAHRKPPNAGKGRKKGVVNKITADARAAIAEIVQGSMADFQAWMAEIKDPKDRCDVFLKLMAYHIPQLARVEAHVRVTRTAEDMTDAELLALAGAVPGQADRPGAGESTH